MKKDNFDMVVPAVFWGLVALVCYVIYLIVEA